MRARMRRRQLYSLEYLPLAQRDLVDIVSYVADRLANPLAAQRLAEKLVDAAESLRTMPHRRRVYTPIRPLEHEYRSIRVENYLMFYWVEEDTKCVTIARVLYAKSDVVSRLGLAGPAS